MARFVLKLNKPDSLAHIFCEDDNDTFCQLFKNKYVKKSNFYISYENEGRSMCKNCLSMYGELQPDTFAPHPTTGEVWLNYGLL